MRTKRLLRALFVGAAATASLLAVVGCDDGSSAVKERPPNAGNDAGGPATDGGLDPGTLPDGAPKDCFDNPKTHFEIINACTSATKVTKNPILPKLLPDGGLPPLD